MIDDKFTPSENAVAKAQVNEELKRLGLLFLSTGNHLSISAEAWNMIDDIPSLNLLANDYVFANEAIDDGILRVDSSTLELYNCDVTEKNLQQMKSNDLAEMVKEQIANAGSALATSHCSYRKVYFGSMVRNNRTELKNYLHKMELLKETNPSIAPGAALLSYWIGKVQPGGAWDYKSVPGYAPYNTIFCLTYGISDKKTNYHRTSEFMGNYNYGFTGRMMFPLTVLKLGSNGAAGNPFKPDTDDYPAIEEGYSDAKA